MRDIVSFEFIWKTLREPYAHDFWHHGSSEWLSGSITGDLRNMNLDFEIDSQKWKNCAADRNRNIFAMQSNCTIITDDFRSKPGLIGALGKNEASIQTVLCGVVLHNNAAWIEFQANIEAVAIATPVAARVSPVIKWAVRDNAFAAQAAESGVIDAGGWRCTCRISAGAGGCGAHMVTVIPIAPTESERLEGQMELVKRRIDACRTLLTLLQGGGQNVPVIGAELRMKNGPDVPILISSIRDFQCLYRLWGRGENLALENALDLVGMRGLENWCKWHADQNNRNVLNYWLYSDGVLGALPSVEGLGRLLLQDQDDVKNVYFVKAIEKVLQQVGFDNDYFQNKKMLGRIHEIYKYRFKHIGDRRQDSIKAYRALEHFAPNFASLLVGFCLLKIGTGDCFDAEVEKKWAQELGNVYNWMRKITALKPEAQ